MKVDLLVDQLSALLAQDDGRAENARARMLIYGIAGFVAEPQQHSLKDSDLRDLVACLAIGDRAAESSAVARSPTGAAWRIKLR
jgi:hypothetical protein